MNVSKLDKNQKLILLYVVSALVLEITFFLLLGLGVFPQYFWLDLGIVLIVCAFIYLPQNFVLKSVVFWIAYLYQFILSLTNIIVKRAASELFSFDMLFLSAEGLQAFEISFIDFARSSVLLSMLAIVIYLYILVAKDKKVQSNIYHKNKLAYILMTFMILGTLGTCSYVGQTALISDTEKSDEFYVFESDKYLYSTLVSKVDAYKKFGTFGFYSKNLYNLITGNSSDDTVIDDTVNYLLSGTQNKSDYFGVSDGNNYISILLETMEYYAIDPYFTPTLYNLFYENENTIKLKNFYANNRTNISEGLTLFGNYDKTNPINVANDNVLEVLGHKDVNFTLPSILQADGYDTRYYHDYVSWYYNRNITHTTAGFDEIVGLESMNKLSKWVDYKQDSNNDYYRWKNWTLDSEVMEMYFDDMTNTVSGVSSEKFYSHFSLITMHGNHDKKPQLQTYYDKLTADIDTKGGHFDNMCDYLSSIGYAVPRDNSDMFYHFLWYKSAAMDVDKMLKTLFDNLNNTYTDRYDNEGNRLTLADTTTVLLFADHNCYYNGMANTMRGIEFSNDVYDPNLYHIPCVIYDKKVAHNYLADTGSTNVEKFCSTYNILPTILDVLGYEYNPLFYQGDHIFTDSINVFQSNISGAPYFTDKFLLSYKTVNYRKEGTTDDEELEFKKGALTTFNRLNYISNIYDHPEILDKYYAKLTGK